MGRHSWNVKCPSLPSQAKAAREDMAMTANLEWVRQVLERRLAEATAPTRELRVSILIQQLADPLDMTLQAAERELTVQA